MTEKEKKPLSETAFDRKLDAALKAVQEAQAKRDAEQDAKLSRPAVDITAKYPLAAWAIGVAFIAGGVLYFDGAKMWTLVGVGVCFVPGLARKAIDLVSGLKKAKGGE